jgi:Mrp family chromosome partitioning ATPase
MNQVLTDLKNAAEVVVLDSPPSMVADAQVLAARVDGVILIVHPAHTHADAALAAAEQMKRAGARILGVVMNRIPKNRSYYYGGYQYYSPYYQGSREKTVPRRASGPELREKGLALLRKLKLAAAWIRRPKKSKAEYGIAWAEQLAALAARKGKSR